VNAARRVFLRRVLAGAAGAPIAAWIGACASRTDSNDGGATRADLNLDAPPDGRADAELLRAAWSRAKTDGRPLFVLVIPNVAAQYQHGEAWGQFLLHGDEAALERLAACTLVAAKMEWVRDVLPDIIGLPADTPSALYIPADGKGVAVVRVDADLAGPPAWDAPMDEREAVYRERVARLGAAITSALPAAAGDAQRLQGEPPAGAAWALDTGCAPELLDHPELASMIACGMAMMPPIATKFLMYLTDLEAMGMAVVEQSE